MGTHPDIVARLVHSDPFPDFLHVLFTGWVEMVRRVRPGQNIVVAFYCRSGRHRCVATSVVSAHLFEATVGMLIPTTRHESAKEWERLCGRGCPQCKGKSLVRDKALLYARQLWRREIL